MKKENDDDARRNQGAKCQPDAGLRRRRQSRPAGRLPRPFCFGTVGDTNMSPIIIDQEPVRDACGGGFNPEAYGALAQAESGNYWFESRNRLIVWAMRRHFSNATSLIELGCGTGFVLLALSKAFPAMQLTGSDASEEGLAYAAARVPSAAVTRMDARDLEGDGIADVVAAFDVLEHIDADLAVLQRMFRATRPGGGVLITVPQHQWLWSRADEYGKHVRRYRRRDIVQRVTSAGFQVERVTSFVSLLLPLMMISRYMERRATKPFDPTREFRISQPLNGALTAVLSAERMLIRAGVSWPAGGSLLVVGRRRT